MSKFRKRSQDKQRVRVLESVGSGKGYSPQVDVGAEEKVGILPYLIKFGTPIGLLIFSFGTILRLLFAPT